MRGLQILGGVTALVAIVAVSVFLYLTRAITLPNSSSLADGQSLETSDEMRSAGVFRIVSVASPAVYHITAVCSGVEKRVVGTTHAITGDIYVDAADLAQTEIGEIRIDARTFDSGDERRDNVVARDVLRAEDHEYIIFVPTQLAGLPDSAAVGEILQFQVSGDLTIAGTRQPVTFAVSAVLENAERLVGQAEATLFRQDFNLTLPDMSWVASVDDAVLLRLDFVAIAVDRV
jgi:polyisoprenoid-binding protein YceI